MRRILLAAGVIATAALHLLAPEAEEDAAVAVVAPAPSKKTVAASADAESAATTEPAKTEAAKTPRERDLDLLAAVDEKSPFRGHTPPAPPPPPPVPTAPPLPFTYSGRMESPEGVVVYLTAGERLIRARAGDIIDQTYNVERIDASTVYLRYIPLDTPQNLAAGK